MDWNWDIRERLGWYDFVQGIETVDSTTFHVLYRDWHRWFKNHFRLGDAVKRTASTTVPFYYYSNVMAQLPLRKIGSIVPSARTPSMSMS